MFSTKTVATTCIVGALLGTASDKVLASVSGAEMPWLGQFGLCGVFAWILWWKIAKTDPAIADSQKSAIVEAAKITASSMDSLKSEVKGLRDDAREDRETTNDLLREALIKRSP